MVELLFLPRAFKLLIVSGIYFLFKPFIKMIGSMSNMTGNILYNHSKKDINSMPRLKNKDWPLITEI